MSKVKLTKKQADAIEKVKRQHLEELKEVRQAYEEGRMERWSRPLFTLNNDEIQKALFEGYEIEPEFKIRDWVVLNGYVGIITKFSPTNNEHAYLDIFEKHTKKFMNVLTYQLRRATPKEIAKEKRRRFWHENGREVWEIKEEDILGYLGDPYIIEWFDSENVSFGEGPTEYMESFDFVKEHFKVICFVEDRKDIKND